MKEIKRQVFPQLVSELKRREVSILLGPRQTGKTFLLRQLEREAGNKGIKTRYYNLELPHDLMEFNKPESDIFNMLTKGANVVFMDEFHYLKNASKIFKAVFDSGKKVKIFASGSSSLEIHKHLKESLAGRRLVTRVAPLSLDEFNQKSRIADAGTIYKEYVTYGGMPGLVKVNDSESKIRLLAEILETYIQKDIKSLLKEENIRAFNNLLYLLAENQGSLVSENSLAREIGLTAATINRHISILENTYVCYAVYSYARRLGNELKKSKKIYFYDLGIRNALLRDFSKLNVRTDIGAINESFVFLQLACNFKPNMEIKFWRNKSGHEIDFVVLKDRKPFIIEVKTRLQTPEIPQAFKIFINNYPETIGGAVLSENLEAESTFMGKKIRFALYPEVTRLI